MHFRQAFAAGVAGLVTGCWFVPCRERQTLATPHHEPATSNHQQTPLYDAAMSFLQALRSLAIVEGVSTLVLFGIAMPLKYFAGMPAAVRTVGLIHGILFTALVLMFLVAIRKVPLAPMLAAAGIVAAVFPGGPFLFDRRLAKLAP
jgi:integral membrane protein